MSVLHSLQIAPKSNTTISLSAIQSFIGNLSSKGFIEKEFAILTGDENAVKDISIWDFKTHSVSGALTKESKLEIVTERDFEKLSSSKNYAFKIHLTNASDAFKDLEVFKSAGMNSFPLFISFFCEPIDAIILKEDEETEETEEISVSNINCILNGSGRNTESLIGLVEYQEEFTVFFDEINNFIGDFEAGTFCS